MYNLHKLLCQAQSGAKRTQVGSTMPVRTATNFAARLQVRTVLAVLIQYSTSYVDYNYSRQVATAVVEKTGQNLAPDRFWPVHLCKLYSKVTVT